MSVKLETREELLLSIADKQYEILNEVGKSIKHLFFYFFALLIIVSAIKFEPEIFGKAGKVVNEGIVQEDEVTFIGLTIKIDGIVKYSSIVLSIIYLMLTTFLVYSTHLRDSLIKTYSSLDPTLEKDFSKLYYPSIYQVISTLSSSHRSSFIQFVFQIFNIVKSFLIYVFPVIIVFTLLNEGVKRSENIYLNILFYFSPILVFTCMIILTREWYITIYRSFMSFIKFIPKSFKTVTYRNITLKISRELLFNVLQIIALLVSLLSVIPELLRLLKTLFI